MATTSNIFEIEAEQEPTLLDRLIWPLFLLLAWAAFELTANATLSLVFACLKFGVNDFRTGWWLWQVDPQRQRARACGAFYVAAGVWKTAIWPLLIAGGITITWAMMAPQAMQRANKITEQLFMALRVGMWAAMILVFLVGAAALLSLAARWRVWVHPYLHRSRKAGDWPPRFEPADYPIPNQAILVVFTAVVVGILLGPVLTLKVTGFFQPPVELRWLLQLLVIFGYPIGGVFAFGFLRSKMFARTPWECWPESIQTLPSTSMQF